VNTQPAFRDDATGAVTLRWRSPASGLGPFGEHTSYAVYRFTAWRSRAPAASRMPASCSPRCGPAKGATQMFVDTAAQPGRRYTYYVTALDRLWSESPVGPPRFVS
jgi:hypothetical protein